MYGVGGWEVGAVVMVAFAARDWSSQQKLNSLTLSRLHNVDRSTGCGEGKQLSEAFNQAPIRL